MSQAMSASKQRTLLAKIKATKSRVSDETKALSETLKAAQEHDHAHLPALRKIAYFDALDPIKRQEELFHFDTYRERMAWNADKDLLPDRRTVAERAMDGDPVDDDELDLRPRHLRQPDASAADVDPPHGTDPSWKEHPDNSEY